jgi:TetR/AcrR family transcriptional regulator, transcriptional repressor for nem operon
MLNFGMEADDTSPVILKKIHALVEGTQKQIASIVTGGINSGEFSQDWNASEFATKIFALLEGGIMISRIAGNNHKMKVIVDMIKKEVEEHIV